MPAPVSEPIPRFDGVMLVTAGADAIVGGLRLVERAAFVLARAGARRLLGVGTRPSGTLRLPDLPVTWADGDAAAVAAWLADRAGAERIVVLEATTVTDPATVAALVAAPGASCLAASGAPSPTARSATLWRSERSALAAHGIPTAPPPDAGAWRLPTGLVRTASDPTSRVDAEAALYERLGRSGDGWFTRVVDRRLSRILTRRLLPTGVAPNTVTVASISIGIIGGLCFATGMPGMAALGAVLFLASTIIDGCDGEIARLTFRESVFGARLDVLGDNLVHLFLFGGIATGLYRRSADATVATLGVVLVLGVLFAMATVYWCVVRREPTAAQRTLYEAFASREFAYILVVLTLAGRLDWFLWLSAVGTCVFSIGLWVLGGRRPDA
jgi:phosphatidylglycerophosphate synthase